uniref:Uncharacterized protein n=1 Tax=Octopus bimaculoides TaxID=37653 RepID=A0A0L8FSK7_OCTBM
MALHKSQIRNPEYREVPVSDHIGRCTLNKNPKFTTFPLYQFNYNTTFTQRQNKELRFIRKFGQSLNTLSQ